MRAAAGSRSQNRCWPKKQQRRPSIRNCLLCKQAGRRDIHHFLSECPHLPEPDRRFMHSVQPKVRGTDVCDFDYEYSDQQHAADEVEPIEQPQVQRIDVRQSPYIDAFCGHHMVRVTIDSGATSNMIRQSTAVRLGCDIKKSSQSAHQADGSSPLIIIGETSIFRAVANGPVGPAMAGPIIEPVMLIYFYFLNCFVFLARIWPE